jgi:hypothetical protein
LAAGTGPIDRWPLANYFQTTDGVLDEVDAPQKAAGDQNQIADRLPAAGIALPQPLRWCLGRRSQELDRDLEQEISDVPLDFVHGPQFMASDGFHLDPPAHT